MSSLVPFSAEGISTSGLVLVIKYIPVSPAPTPIVMPRIKAILFDFMGTCLDWHSSIVSALPASLSDDSRSRFALEWRQTYFDYNAARLAAGPAH
ncbi:hypothetical protein FB45DRAFT_1044208 [Roridomyces roridus]|uniref:Uncharacterized protein n=1 Tax=Roridomyces roridus TaxID=1738132 RepID=A0AAD7F819_9AGAR|nr:hypothetical protein FB45DRAFT_1044208 [Roridomyces roridus]